MGKNSFDLNDIAFKKLKECRTNREGTIPFKTIWSKICRNFSIPKKDCVELLKHFESLKKIEFVTQKGIKIRK